MKKNLLRWSGLLWCLALVACTAATRLCEPCLCPEVHLTIEDGDTVIRFGVCNTGTAEFAGDPGFSGELCLYDETGTLLSRQSVQALGPVAAQEMVLPGQCSVDLLPGKYHLTYYSETCGYTEADFWVMEQDGVRWLKTPQLFEQYGGG